jgi:uncharacterized repeat protein (TIGR03803 family)
LAVVTVTLIVIALASTAWAAEYKVLYKFQARTSRTDGRAPSAGLIFDAAGNLYGTTDLGGVYDYGTVFKLAPNPDGSWSEGVIHRFSYHADGAYPSALIFDAAGNLYGTTTDGGACCGSAFELTPNPDGRWSENVLYSFVGPEGAYPFGGVIFDGSGNLYGTTETGLDYSLGTVFKLTPNPDGGWSQSVIHGFSGTDGASPYAGVIFDAAGNLYGTTLWGGAYGAGTAFQLSPNPDGSWSESVMHSFGGSDGALPWAGLIFDATGHLYGTTNRGGAYDLGTVFKLTPNPDGSWSESVIHDFSWTGGAYPYAGVIFDAAGNLYGTTWRGGAYDRGTVFKLTPNPDGSWSDSVIHDFSWTGGVYPYAGLVMDADGSLYGTTQGGGRIHSCAGYGCGVVFKITP